VNAIPLDIKKRSANAENEKIVLILSISVPILVISVLSALMLMVVYLKQEPKVDEKPATASLDTLKFKENPIYKE
jgi:hypothetical protein